MKWKEKCQRSLYQVGTRSLPWGRVLGGDLRTERLWCPSAPPGRPSPLMFTRGCQRVSVFWPRFPGKQRCRSRAQGGDMGRRPQRAQPRARTCGLVPVRLLRPRRRAGRQSSRCHRRSFSSPAASSLLSPANDSPVCALNRGGPCGSPPARAGPGPEETGVLGEQPVPVSCAWRVRAPRSSPSRT